MLLTDLTELETWDADTGRLNVVIETPKGSRNKFAFDPQTRLFELSKVLPRGEAFPFDFGFIPSTLAEDGDPLDVLALLDEPIFPGCRVQCRVLGVIEAEQQEGKHGKAVRNDRLIAAAEECHEHRGVKSIKELPDVLLEEIEYFFISYHELDGAQFTPLARRGPRKAEKLIQKAEKRFHKHRDGG